MKNESKIQKIYTMSIVGGKDSINEVKALNNAFDELRETKKKLNTELGKALVDKKTTADIDALNNKIAETDKQMKSVSAQKKKAEADTIAQAKAEKILADIKVQEAKAEKELALANKARTQDIIAQDKELERLIAKEEKQKKGVQEVTGYYNKLKKELDELYKLVRSSDKGDIISFRGTNMNYDQAIGKLKELSAAEQEFRRQFQKDGTLVGEYTTGIIQAFKKMGLDDLIGGQVTKANQRLKELDATMDMLKQDYDEIKKSGVGAFDAIEKEMVENRKESQNIQRELAGLDQRMQSVQSVGDKVTTGLKNGFRDAGRQLATYAVGFFTVQQGLAAINAGLQDAKQVEGVREAFENLNKPDLLGELRKATKGTVKDLELMRQAVQASNFQIPLEQLAGLLDFARKRAKDTGQDVDYLVQSIILGIGRKSPLILDNLGISAVRLRQKMKGLSEEQSTVGDVAKAVGEIIKEESAKSSKDIDTQSEKISQNTSKWQNLRQEFGTKLLPAVTMTTSVLLALVSVFTAIPWPVTTAAVLYFTGALVKNYVATSIATKEGLIYSASLVVQQIRTQAVALWTQIATAEIVLFNGAIRFSPIGVFLGLLALVVPAVALFANNTRNAKVQLDALNSVNGRANQLIGDQISKMNAWMAIIKSTATSADTKRKAMESLIAVDSRFKDAMQGDIIILSKLKSAYDEVSKSIRTKAQVQAATALAGEKEKDLINVSKIRQRLESQFANTKGGTIGIMGDSVTPEELELLKSLSSVDRTRSFDGNGSFSFSRKDFPRVIAELKKREEQSAQAYQAYIDLQISKQSEFDKLNNVNQVTAVKNEVDIDALKKNIEALDKQIDQFKGSKGELDKLIAERKTAQTTLDKLLGNTKDDNKGSRLSGADKDLFKDIEARYGQLVALEKNAMLQIQKGRELTMQEEIDYNNRITSIEKQSINEKLRVMQQKKTLNAEEKRTVTELKNQLLDLDIENNKKTQDLRDKEYKKQEDELRKDFDQKKKALENQLTDAESNFYSSEEQKIQAKTTFNTSLLQLEKDKYVKLLALDQQYAKDSVITVQERDNAIKALQSDIDNSLFPSFIRSNELKEQKILDDAYLEFQQQLNKVYSDRTLSAAEQKKKIKEITDEYEKQIAKVKINVIQSQVQPFLFLKAMGLPLPEKAKELIKEYWRIVNEENAKAQAKISPVEEAKRKSKFSLKGLFGDILGTDLGQSKKDFKLLTADEKQIAAEEQKMQRWNMIYTQAAEVTKMFYENLFAMQQAAIEKNKKEQLSVLEKEKDRKLSAAESADEREAIEKRYQQRKYQIEKEAFEKNKTLQKNQVKIQLMTELAAIAAQAAANPANAVTFGGAGIAQYAILAGLAIGRNVFQLSQINAQQFAEGGQVQPAGNGVVSINPNIATQPNGDNVLATVKVGEVVLNEKQQRALGGARTFSAIGVPGFAGGGRVSSSIDNMLSGGGTQAPIVSSSNGKLVFGEQQNDVLEMIQNVTLQVEANNKQISKMSAAIMATDRKPVVAQEVEAKNNSFNASSEIGSF